MQFAVCVLEYATLGSAQTGNETADVCQYGAQRRMFGTT